MKHTCQGTSVRYNNVPKDDPEQNVDIYVPGRKVVTLPFSTVDYIHHFYSLCHAYIRVRPCK